MQGKYRAPSALSTPNAALLGTDPFMAAAPVPMVEPVGIGAQQPAHALHQVGVRRLHHQMKMISHQTISVDLEAGFLTRLGQGLEEIVAVPLIQKDRFPAVSPAEEMINGPGIFDSDLARHRLDSPPSPSPPQAQKCPKLWFDPNGA